MNLLKLRTVDDLAQFLGTRWRDKLAPFLYAEPINRHYYSFFIPKRAGGLREVSAPKEALKAYQQKIAVGLSEIYRPTPIAHGFQAGRSIVTNAAPHTASELLATVDIKDFFHSINFGRVRGLFMSPPFKFPAKLATVIAHAVCLNGGLPQGAPTSPALSNMISRTLDKSLLAFSKRAGLSVTRYADDVAFSGRAAIFSRLFSDNENSAIPPAIPSTIRNIFTKAGFVLNDDKFRVRKKSERMQVTGIVVNSKLSVPREKYRRIRSMLHWVERMGELAASEKFASLVNQGKVNGAKTLHLPLFLRGWILHISHVRGEYDPQALYLKRRFNSAFPHQAPFLRVTDRRSLPSNVVVLEAEGVVRKLSKGKVTKTNFGPQQGTAFAISSTYFVTCDHCIGPENYVVKSSDNTRFRAWIVARDPRRDLAILRVNSDVGCEGLEIRNAPPTHWIGMPVKVVGFPSYAPGASVAQTATQITQELVRFGRKMARVGAQIVAGNSGGPVLDTRGRVVGVAVNGTTTFQSGSTEALYGILKIQELTDFLKEKSVKLF